MTALASNTFQTVSFNPKAQFDIESLVTEFQHVHDDAMAATTELRWVHGRFVSVDLGRAQLSLAYSSATVDRDNQRGQQASLAVCVDAGESFGKIGSPENRAMLPLYGAETLATARISSPTVAPKRIRKLTKATRRSRPGMPESCGYQTTILPAEPIKPTHPALYADRIKQARSIAPLQTRPLPRQVALGLPQTESRDLNILREVFLSNQADADEQVTERTVAHRLAIYTLNTSLVVICLPVGVAMFSYCALGRESLNAVGRAMALTGIGIALAQSSLLGTVLPLIG